MRRNKSLPPEHMENLPDIANPKKDNLISMAAKLFDSQGNPIPNPLGALGS